MPTNHLLKRGRMNQLTELIHAMTDHPEECPNKERSATHVTCIGTVTSPDDPVHTPSLCHRCRCLFHLYSALYALEVMS